MAKGDIIIFKKNVFRRAWEFIRFDVYQYVRFDMMKGKKPPRKVAVAFSTLAGGVVLAAAGNVTFNAGSPTPTSTPINSNQNFRNYALSQGCSEIVVGSDDIDFQSPGYTRDTVIPGDAVPNCVLTGKGNDVVHASAQPDKIDGDNILDTNGNLLTNITDPTRGPFFDRADYRRADGPVHVDLIEPRNNKGKFAIGDTYRGIEAFSLTRFHDTYRGTLARNSVEGGAGTDTAVFAQPLSRYTLTRSGSNMVVTGPDGAGSYGGFERFLFADKLVTVASGGTQTVIDRDQVGTTGPDDPLTILPTSMRVFGDLGNDLFIPHAMGCPDGVIQVFGDDTKNLVTGEIIWRPSSHFNIMDYSAQPDRLVYHPTDRSKIKGSMAECYQLNGIQLVKGSVARPAELNTYQNIFYAGTTGTRIKYVGGPFNDAAHFKGNRADYTLQPEADGRTTAVTPNAGTNTGDGVTRLENIETLFFNDGRLHKQEPFQPYLLSVEIRTSEEVSPGINVRVMPPTALGAVVCFGRKLGEEILSGPNAETNIKRIIAARMAGQVLPGFDSDGVGRAGSALGEGTRCHLYRASELTQPKQSFLLGQFNGSAFQPYSITKRDRIGVIKTWVMPGSDGVFAPYHLRPSVADGNKHLTELLNDAYVTNSTAAERAALLDNGHAAACWAKKFYPTQLQQHIDAAGYNDIIRQLHIEPKLTDAACANFVVRNHQLVP